MEELRDVGVGVKGLSIFIIVGIVSLTSTAIEAIELLYKLVYYRIV